MDRREFLKLAGKVTKIAVAAAVITPLLDESLSILGLTTYTPYQEIPTNTPGKTLNLDEKNRPKIGLALGGGGLKGLAHFGVILSLIKNNIPIDFVSGTSVGSIVGAIYCSREKWTIEKWEKVIEKAYKLGIFDILGGADMSELTLQSFEKLENLIKEFIPNVETLTFEQLKKPLSVVATTSKDAKKVTFTKGNLIKALLASCSIPVVYPDVSIDNTYYSDGGINERVPTEELIEHAEYIIASDVGFRPSEDYRSKNPFVKFIYSLMLKEMKDVYESEKYCDKMIISDLSKIDALSIYDCKKGILIGYKTTESIMSEIIESIRSKAR